MKVTDKDIIAMRDLASRLNLVGKDRLFDNSPELIAKVCNGIGPEWFPAALRDAIDRLHPSLKVVAMIHDLDYYFGDGTTEDFNKANSAFAANGIVVADDRYGWYDPRRYLARHSARKFAALCAVGGRVAYNKAIRDRQMEVNMT
jgi:hypothetical protein